MKRMLLFVAGILSCTAFAQESAQAPISVPKAEVKLSYIDSLKATFTHNEALARIDSLWVKELTNDALFATMQEEIHNVNPDSVVVYPELSSEVLKQRLAAMDALSPFHIEYNTSLENVIKSYLKNRKKTIERIMVLSEYYFPMFEEHLAKYDIPMELKYLAIVESALNPRAKSRVGASGLWQFMYPTGKQFKLEVNSYIDERYDPLKATEAACQYLSSLYRIFGDWDLVLASYNAGPGNVTKAMRRSGGKKNYWNIRPKLPRETRGYVPAFLATMYMFEYADAHGIKPAGKAPIAYAETDTVQVQRQMSFTQVSNLLDIPVAELQLLNPVYKLDVVPYSSTKPFYLRLPKNKIGLFTANEEGLYAYIDYEASQREQPIYDGNDAVVLLRNGKKKITTTKTYRVRSGDNLGAIAQKHGVSVAKLKRWNGIRGTMIRVGQRLKIHKTKIVAIPKKEKEAIAAAQKKQEKVQKVKPANTEVATPKPEEAIAANTKAPIAEQTETVATTDEKVTEDATAIEAPTEPEIAPTTEVAVAETPKQKRAEAANYEEERMYIVKKGDSLFSIAKKLPGVTVENLKNWNKNTIEGDNLQPGMELRVILN